MAKTNKLNKQDKEQIKKDITEQVKADVQKKVEKKVVDDVVKKIKEESIKELKDNFVYEVKSEVKSQIIKEEKKLLRHSKWKIIRRDIVIIILLLVIGYMGYLLYQDNYFSINKKNNNINKTVETSNKEVKDKKWYLENYSYLLDLTHLKLSSDNINKYYLYNKDYQAEDINNSIKLTLAYNLLDEDDIKKDDNQYKISNDDMKKAYKKLFDTDYKSTTFSVECMTFSYKNNEYVAYKNECNNINNYEVTEEIIDIYEQNSNIVIKTIMGVENNNMLYNYSDLYKPVTDDLGNNSLMDYKGSLNSYKYTFAKKDGDYKFVKIEKQ